MKNSVDLGGCYPPWPSGSVDNTLLDPQNSIIIAKYYTDVLGLENNKTIIE